MPLKSSWLVVSLVLAATTASAQNSTEAGKFVVEHPTLLNLGFEWAIRGDANRNATVDVEFRAVGETAWRKALPLVRIGGENVYRRAREPRLHRSRRLRRQHPEPAARDRVRVPVRVDRSRRRDRPDESHGAGENAHRAAAVDARAARCTSIRPTIKGPRQEPSFTSLLQAYYGAGLGDWSVVWERRAQPGDTILMHAGLYKPERLNYVDPQMAPFDGTMSLTLEGHRAKGRSRSRRPATAR